MWSACVDAGALGARLARRRRAAACGDDEGQCRAGPYEVVAHGSVPPGGQPFPNALLKADRQELPCRCARTGLPLGVQVSWLADRYLSPPSRGPLPQWLFFRTESPRLQLRDSSGFAPDSLGAWFRILAFLRLLIGPGQPEVTGLSRDWHGEDEAVGLEGELEVAWWETGPGAAHRVCVALAVLEWLEQSLNIGLLVVDDRLHVERARVILGMVGGSDQREHVWFS